MKKLMLLILSILAISGCRQNNIISMGGSSSILPLANEIKDDYQAEVPGMQINYDGPGSSKGIEGIKNGIYQFGFLSREVKDNEKTPDMVIQTIALDGIVIVVNNHNPITNLNSEQIKDIYQGNITNWKEVGGNDQVISLIARDNASGTRNAFDDILGIDSVSENALLYDSNGAVSQAVEQNPAAIGYVSFDTLARKPHLVNPLSVDGVSATSTNVQNNTYKLYRPFIMAYYPEKLTANSQSFLKWLEDNLNRLVQEAGFIVVGGENESTAS